MIPVDPASYDLARHFLADHDVAEPRSDAQIAADLKSLSEAIQTAVENWFSANPADAS